MARICIVRHSYYPQETHVRRDAETLRDRGHEVHLICLRDQGQRPRETIDGIHVHRVPLQHKRLGIVRYLFEYTASFLLVFVVLSALHLRHRFTSVEVDTMPDFLVFATLLPKLTGARIVLYLFEAMPEEFMAKYGVTRGHPVVRILALIERSAIRYADSVLTACKAFKDRFVARGAPPAKIRVILNVPNERVFAAAHRHTQSCETAGGFRLITHGTLTELYGVQVALRAVARLKEQLPELTLVVAGDGEYSHELRRLARDLGLEDRVTFTGWVDQEQIVRLIQAADAGIVPILGGYGDMMVPNKLFEYVALGTPAISSSLAGIRDYFDERSLLFFAPGDDAQLADRIRTLRSRPDHASSMVRQAETIYEAHRWTREQAIYYAQHEAVS